MVQLEKTIAQLRICSDMLVEVDNWENFFPIVLVLRKELEPLLPKPYIGAGVPLPPATIFAVVDELNKLESCEISVAEFICDTLDPTIEKLDKAVYTALSVAAFEACLADLLQSLALREAVKDEVVDVRIKAQQEVDNATTALWTAFSALPAEERKNRLPPPPTKEED